MASYENYGEETRWMLHQNVTYGIDKLTNKEFYVNLPPVSSKAG